MPDNSSSRFSFFFRLIIFTVLLFCVQLASAQRFYKMRYSTEIGINAIGLGSLVTAFILDKKADLPDLELIKLLDANDIWKPDRWTTKRWSRKAAKASDALLFSSVIMPGFLLINKNVRDEYYIGIVYLESLIFTAGVTNLAKTLTKRERPFMYGTNATDEQRGNKDALRSFFSGHTSITANSSFFMAKVYSDMNPDSRFKPLIWTTAAIIPAITGLLRMIAGKHFLTDVFVGYLIGAAAGILVPHLHSIGSESP